jgi:hypothetical protein
MVKPSPITIEISAVKVGKQYKDYLKACKEVGGIPKPLSQDEFIHINGYKVIEAVVSEPVVAVNG